MMKQYRILTDCLTVLKTSDLPMIEKLRFEVQLIQAKRHLLDDQIGSRIKAIPSSEEEFLDLYRQLEEVCSSPCNATRTAQLLQQLHALNEGLKSLLTELPSQPTGLRWLVPSLRLACS